MGTVEFPHLFVYALSLSLLACAGAEQVELAQQTSMAVAPAAVDSPAEPAASSPAAATSPEAGVEPTFAEGCLRHFASVEERSCSTESDCVVLTGSCSSCWGTVNSSSESAVRGRVQEVNARKKCRKADLSNEPEAMCEQGSCTLLEPGEVAGS